MEEKNKFKIYLVKTDKCCFISDCDATDGYHYNYHSTKLNEILFDGEYPSNTFYLNWYRINSYPNKIQKYCKQPDINIRYELINKELESEKIPLIIPYDEKYNYDSNVIENLYNYAYDTQEEILEDVDCEIEIVLEVENFNEPPVFDFEAIEKNGFEDRKYTLKNSSIQHQLVDKMVFPSVVLHEFPCKITSKQLYDITRQYIIDNINNKVATISSNYDFCFTVEKLVPLIEPEEVSYQNIFAKTKRERNKIHTTIKKYNKFQIFEMTSEEERYRGYSAIPSVEAKNEYELKEKIDSWLKTIIDIINSPLVECPCCKGKGYVGEPEKVKFME